MDVKYRLFESILDPNDLDTMECEERITDTDKLSSIVRKAFREYNIRAFDSNARAFGCWASDYPIEDRAFFEQGLHRYYSIDFPGLNPRHYPRVNKMFAMLEGK